MFFGKGTISLIRNNVRNASSYVTRFRMNKNIAEDFYGLVTESCQQLEIPGSQIKDFSRATGERGAKQLENMVKKDAQLLQAFEQARKTESSATIITDIKMPEFEEKDIPTDVITRYSKSFVTKFRPAEIISYAYAKLLGIKPNDKLVAAIYADDSHLHIPNSFKTGGDLRWHNDGWGSNDVQHPYALLAGIKRPQGVLTEIITFDQLKEHFIKSGKENLWEVLNHTHYIAGEMIPEPMQVVDDKNKKLNYAEYCNLIAAPGYGILLPEAITFLNETLHRLQPLVSENIGSGMIASWKNDESVHRRKVPKNIPTLSGKSLATRIHGDRDDNDKSK